MIYEDKKFAPITNQETDTPGEETSTESEEEESEEESLE